MDIRPHRVVTAKMQVRSRDMKGTFVPKKRKTHSKQLLRNTAIFAVVSFCLAGAVGYAMRFPQKTQAVMSHFTGGFEYDDTLGRLQFVSNVLPESAMVFLSNNHRQDENITPPAEARIIHAWNQTEPWLEYAHIGDVSSCLDGDVMTIVKNRQNEYTVRIMHSDGYESVYSGLKSVHLKESESVYSGQSIGTAAGFAAFELRKDGLSIQPSFL